MTKSKIIKRVAAAAATLIATLGIGFGLRGGNVSDDINENKDINRVEGELQIHYMDVGQGDGILIESETGKNYYIDGGSTTVKEVGKYRIVPCLKSKGISSIDYLILTHTDADHIGGLDVVLYKIPCEKVLLSIIMPTREKCNP